jgi:hypothetical protein
VWSTVTPLFLGLILQTIASTTNIQSNICRNPSTPIIQTPTSDTTTSLPQALIGGLGSPDSVIELEVNDNLASTLTTDSNGNFGASVSLNSGQNQVVAIAHTACGVNVDSPSITVTYTPITAALTPAAPDTAAAPASQSQTVTSGTLPLRVFSPKQVTTHGSSIQITGETIANAELSVSINEVEVAKTTSSSTGYFSIVIPLNNGINYVPIKAVSATATATVSLTITRSADALPAPLRTALAWYVWAFAATIALALLAIFRGRRAKEV